MGQLVGRIERLEAGNASSRCPACGLLSAEPIRYGLVLPDMPPKEPTRCRRCGTALALIISVVYLAATVEVTP